MTLSSRVPNGVCYLCSGSEGVKKKKKKELMGEEDGRKNKSIMLIYYMTAFTFSLVFVCDSGVMPQSQSLSLPHPTPMIAD